MQQILEERNRLYQENANLQTQSDYYEQCAREATSVLSEKEAIIEHQEDQLRSQTKTIVDQREQILYLRHQVDKLCRQIWGQKSEKYIPDDPQQRWLDFEGLDPLPEEKQQASGIADEIKAYKESRTKVRKETKPARRPLPENLERIINAITPEEVIGHEDEYVEVDPETREVLVYNPGSCLTRLHVISLDADLRKMDAGRDALLMPKGRITKALSYTYNIYHPLAELN